MFILRRCVISSDEVVKLPKMQCNNENVFVTLGGCDASTKTNKLICFVQYRKKREL